jgi:hypothetical protein
MEAQANQFDEAARRLTPQRPLPWPDGWDVIAALLRPDHA